MAQVTLLPLPTPAAMAGSDAPRTDTPRIGAPARPRDGLHVLLAAGADCRRRWLADLTSAGHLAVTVDDADLALEAMARDAFDIVLLDLALPEAVEVAKLARFLWLGERVVPMVGLAADDADLGQRHGGALDLCLHAGGGAAALAAAEAIVPAAPQAGADRAAGGGAATVIPLQTYRTAQRFRQS